MRGLLFLLSALFLLESTDGNKEYHQLSQNETNIIDRAIQVANEKYGAKHLDFALILKANSDKHMLHVLLRSTSCDKTKPSVHREDCKIQDKTKPQVSCVDCHGSMSCLLLRETDKIKETVSKCLHGSSGKTDARHPGGAHTLFVKAENEQKTGCLGCI